MKVEIVSVEQLGERNAKIEYRKGNGPLESVCVELPATKETVLDAIKDKCVREYDIRILQQELVGKKFEIKRVKVSRWVTKSHLRKVTCPSCQYKVLRKPVKGASG